MNTTETTEQVAETTPVETTEAKPDDVLKPTRDTASLLDIPQVRELIVLINSKAEALKSAKGMQPFMRKMKLKQIQTDARRYQHVMSTVHTGLLAIEKNSDNDQAKADTEHCAKVMALLTQDLLVKYGKPE